MRNLVRRYVTQEQRKAENEGVTEDDVNEIKNDISAFRFELIEILRQSGMNTSSATGPGGKHFIIFKTITARIKSTHFSQCSFEITCFEISGAAGKKNRQKERRLMKGFNLAAGGAGNVGGGRGSVTPGSAGINNGNRKLSFRCSSLILLCPPNHVY